MWLELPLMADRYALQHQILGAGSTGTGWTKEFPTLEEARRAADEDWWTADSRAVRQTISDTSTGKQYVRRQDGAWITVPRAGHLHRRSRSFGPAGSL